MKKFLQSDLVSTSLAIFSMLFGAGNLMFPLKVGVDAGSRNLWAMAGFLLTATMLPILGLSSMSFFGGDYKKFFMRVGKVPGYLLICICMLIIGPLIAMPRIVTLSYTMLTPILPSWLGALPFSIIFLALTFLATYKEGKIVDLLGKYVSPLLVLSLIFILVKGLLFTSYAVEAVTVTETAGQLFWKKLLYGYKTLDLLGGIFFASIVFTIIKQQQKSGYQERSPNQLAIFILKAGIIGAGILAAVYLGMSYLGVYYGQDLNNLHEGMLFVTIAQRVLGQHGALIISTSVLMACYSTIIALAAILADFLQNQLFPGRISYVTALAITLIATLIPAHFELGALLKFSDPIIAVTYPVFITMTFCNLAYKLFGFKPIRIPTLVTLILAFAALWY